MLKALALVAERVPQERLCLAGGQRRRRSRTQNSSPPSRAAIPRPSHAGGKLAAEPSQQRVAGRMAEGVVVALEAVQIGERQREASRSSLLGSRAPRAGRGGSEVRSARRCAPPARSCRERRASWPRSDAGRGSAATRMPPTPPSPSGISTNAVARTVRSVAVTAASFVVSSSEGSGSRSFRSTCSSLMMFSISSSAPAAAVAVVARRPGEEPLDRGLEPRDDGLALGGDPARLANSAVLHAVERVVEHAAAPCAASRARSGRSAPRARRCWCRCRLSAWTARRCPDVWTPAWESPSAPFWVTIAAHTASAPSATTASDMPSTAIRAKSFEGERQRSALATCFLHRQRDPQLQADPRTSGRMQSSSRRPVRNSLEAASARNPTKPTAGFPSPRTRSPTLTATPGKAVTMQTEPAPESSDASVLEARRLALFDRAERIGGLGSWEWTPADRRAALVRQPLPSVRSGAGLVRPVAGVRARPGSSEGPGAGPGVVAALAAGSDMSDLDYRIVRADGDVRHLHATCPVVDESDPANGTCSVRCRT